MTAALWALGAGCAIFGVVARWAVDRIGSPAAAALLRGRLYARGVLSGFAQIPQTTVRFSWFSWSEIIGVVVTVLAGIAIARRSLEPSRSRPILVLRGWQSGSVNDYATYLVLGMLLAIAFLIL